MSIVYSAWRDGLRPDPIMDIGEWSNTYRYLSMEGAAEYGKYDIERMPYLKKPARSLSPQSKVQYVYVCKAVQLGFTELGNNALFTYADLYPCPMVMIMPTRDLLKKHLEAKFWSGIKTTPRISNKIEERKQGAIDASSTTYAKFPGGYISGVWSESKSSFASGSYLFVYMSDVDRFPDDVGGEGDTVALAENRANSFGHRRKIYGESSPTKKRNSKIYAEAMNGDRQYYFMRCPHCSEMIYFNKDYFVYEEKDYNLLGDVKYTCKHCGVLIEEWQKIEMMKTENGADWIATNLEWVNPLRETYFINSFYSPFISWNEIIEKYLDAKKDQKNKGKSHKLKVWYNTYYGTIYEDEADAMEHLDLEIDDLMNRREKYTKIPKNTVLLSAGVDTQGNRFEISIIAWIDSREKYIVSHYIISGDPADITTQKKLDKLLFDTFFEVEGGGEMKVFCSTIDTGGNKTNHIYEYVRRRPKRNLYAIKGGKSIDDPIVKDTGSIVATKKNKKLKLYILGVNSAKDEIYEDIKESFGNRYIHFPQNIIKYFDSAPIKDAAISDEDYFSQLLAESCDSSGRWVNINRARNEAVDTIVYGIAAPKIRGVDIDKLAELKIKAYFKKGEKYE